MLVFKMNLILKFLKLSFSFVSNLPTLRSYLTPTDSYTIYKKKCTKSTYAFIYMLSIYQPTFPALHLKSLMEPKAL